MATLKIMFPHKNSTELQHVLDTHGMTDHGIDALLTGSTAADKEATHFSSSYDLEV